jgi:hypothetical protein
MISRKSPFHAIQAQITPSFFYQLLLPAQVWLGILYELALQVLTEPGLPKAGVE